MPAKKSTPKNLRGTRQFISKEKLESGMLVEFSYRQEYGDKTVKTYQILVIDPRKKNERGSEDLLHGILVEDLNDEDLLKLANSLSGTSIMLEGEKAPLANLKSTGILTNYNASAIKGNRKYRTFLLKNIQGTPRQILLNI